MIKKNEEKEYYYRALANVKYCNTVALVVAVQRFNSPELYRAYAEEGKTIRTKASQK